MDATQATEPLESPITTNVCDTPVEAERAVARQIADAIRAGQRVNRRTVLGLATGATQVGLYRELVRLHREESLSFASVETFNLDEFCGIGPDHPGSFAFYMRTALFDHVDLPASRAHVPDGLVNASEVDAHCERYEEQIRAAGGIDMQLLGIGANGHIAFNEPGSDRSSRTRVVDLAHMTRQGAQAFFTAGEPPRRAITMGVATILEAKAIRVLAFGAGKAEIVGRVLREAVSPDLPATFLHAHPAVEFWLDRAAARSLPA